MKRLILFALPLLLTAQPALAKANDDEAWRHEARVRGLARAARFTWQEAVERTRAVFEAALA